MEEIERRLEVISKIKELSIPDAERLEKIHDRITRFQKEGNEEKVDKWTAKKIECLVIKPFWNVFNYLVEVEPKLSSFDSGFNKSIDKSSYCWNSGKIYDYLISLKDIYLADLFIKTAFANNYDIYNTLSCAFEKNDKDAFVANSENKDLFPLSWLCVNAGLRSFLIHSGSIETEIEIISEYLGDEFAVFRRLCNDCVDQYKQNPCLNNLESFYFISFWHYVAFCDKYPKLRHYFYIFNRDDEDCQSMLRECREQFLETFNDVNNEEHVKLQKIIKELDTTGTKKMESTSGHQNKDPELRLVVAGKAKFKVGYWPKQDNSFPEEQYKYSYINKGEPEPTITEEEWLSFPRENDGTLFFDEITPNRQVTKLGLYDQIKMEVVLGLFSLLVEQNLLYNNQEQLNLFIFYFSGRKTIHNSWRLIWRGDNKSLTQFIVSTITYRFRFSWAKECFVLDSGDSYDNSNSSNDGRNSMVVVDALLKKLIA